MKSYLGETVGRLVERLPRGRYRETGWRSRFGKPPGDWVKATSGKLLGDWVKGYIGETTGRLVERLHRGNCWEAG